MCNFYKPLLSGHLGRSRRSPLNRHFTVIYQLEDHKLKEYPPWIYTYYSCKLIEEWNLCLTCTHGKILCLWRSKQNTGLFYNKKYAKKRVNLTNALVHSIKGLLLIEISLIRTFNTCSYHHQFTNTNFYRTSHRWISVKIFLSYRTSHRWISVKISQQ